MCLINRFEFTRIVVFLGASLLATAGIGAELNRSVHQMFCPRTGPIGTDYVSIIIDIDELAIATAEDDGASDDYEINFLIESTVYRNDYTPQFKAENRLCGTNGVWWYREFPIYTLSKGAYHNYDVNFRAIVHNVPSDAVVLWTLRLDEVDDFSGTDYGDISPGPNQRRLFLQSYLTPERTSVEIGDPQNELPLLPFGESARYEGDGRGTDFGAGVRFKIYIKDQVEIDGAVPAPPKQGAGSGGDGQAVMPPAVAEPPATPELIEVPVKDVREEACRSYALQAVEMNQVALSRNCGFAPPVWSNDHQMHFDWCMQGDNSKRMSVETDRRTAMLADCAKSADPDQACRGYADTSVAQFHSAQSRGCGFAPPVWSGDWSAHFNWCRAVGSAVALPELTKRDTALTSCGN